jgi:MFS transporter, DHA1 family, multidrug resistance protein
VAAPLVGIAGAGTMVPLGVVTTGSVALAVAAFALLRTRRTTADEIAEGTQVPDPDLAPEPALAGAGTC